MTNDELAAKIGDLAAGIKDQFSEVNDKVASIDRRFDALEQKSDSLEQKMDDGFRASRVRDEELRALTQFGLEAREVLCDEMHRRFDEADHKHDQQMTLLNDAIQHLSSR